MKAKVSIICLILLLGEVSIAQDFSEKSYLNTNRLWLIEVPLWVPGFRGQLSYGDITFDSSGSTEEKERERVSSALGIDFYFVGRVRFSHRRFHFVADAFAGKINSVFTYKILNQEKDFAEVAIQGIFPRLSAGYSVARIGNERTYLIEFIPYVGVRHVNFSLKSEAFLSAVGIDVNPGYFQPIIGIYVPIIYNRWQLETQFDYGVVEKKFSWIITSSLRYRISKLIDLKLGYNHMNLLYKQQVSDKTLKLDIRLSGPALGIGFRF